MADDAEIDRARVERDAHLGLLGGGLAVVGIDLDEFGCHLRALPDRFVEVAVERDGLALRDALGGEGASLLRGGGVNCRAKVTAGTSSAPRSRQISRVTRSEANGICVVGSSMARDDRYDWRPSAVYQQRFSCGSIPTIVKH